MTSQKHIALVRHLRGKSLEGQLEWEESALGGAFEVALSNYTIRISPENEDYRVSILNREGKFIESFTDVDMRGTTWEGGRTTFQVFEEIYEVARRISFGVEEALNDILEELEKGKIPF